MTMYLPVSGRTGSRSSMRIRLISMLLMFVILFGSFVAPETAHAENLLTRHGIVVVAMHDHADAEDQDGQQQKGNSPCHALVHHHCGIALAADPDAAALTVWTGKAVVMPLVVQPMRSIALAPLTEPPAA